MKFSLVAATAIVSCAAQGTDANGKSVEEGSNPKPDGAVTVHVVSVGLNPVNNATGQRFWPDNIKAAPGDMVQFQFLAGNHSVEQSSFDLPCQHIGQSDPTVDGFSSSFMPVAASAAKGEMPVFTIHINSTKPIWAYCGQSPHCKNGMSMVINENTSANATRSLSNYRALAAGRTLAEDPACSPESNPESNPGYNPENPSSGGSATSGGGTTTSGTQGTDTPPSETPGIITTSGASLAGLSSSLILCLVTAFMLR